MSSYSVTALQTRPTAAGHRGDLRVAPWVLAVLVVALAFDALTGILSVREVAVVAFGIQLVTGYLIIRVRDRTLSISSVFAVLWIIYFPFRLLVITFGEPSPYYFPAVRSASPEQLTTVCEITSAAFLLFLVGQLFANRSFHARGSVDNSQMMYWQLFAVGVGGIGVTAALTIFRISSGILSNVGDVVLFAIAGMAYLEAKTGRRSYASLLVVVVASTLGYLAGFKLLMLLPLGAWLIGRGGAGDRVRLRYLAVAAAATALAFGIVQGERDATLAGRSVSNPISALQLGASSYDLAYGVPADSHGLGIVGNLVNGVLYRLKGADYYIAISDSVPSRVPYQDGLSLWQPALSILPGAKQFLGLEPQYRQLSLMEYADQAFHAQTLYPVAQSVTAPGDLYLNFGITGVLIGMMILGMLYGMFDRAFVIKGPLSAGVVAFAGLPLVELDPNLAYTIVTCGLHLGICALLLTWISLSQRTASQREQAR
jgi:hypothetical protein